MSQFVCDGTCAGNELGDCNHGDSNDGLSRSVSRAAAEQKIRLAALREAVLVVQRLQVNAHGASAIGRAVRAIRGIM